ncbi:methyltransferase [Parapedobacter sp. SGR-10]|uniref:tRNA1(Val) (adenine(37)-N6)-methyltransferase n=1 Tax=Parapedobacter sp. SGR-10 TaxID=2710879 RepID=UPI0013D5CC1E|nr:methyltransferase [Parapedobacter sp. SGR-10]NGF57518.1 methyltransferase [Parapedobacter sp. SGR-10]
MKNTLFRFKEFEVDQTGCAMKINTDGVLLGAMADSDVPRYILDIGTGTGVIAMMLAQRFPSASIDAVEIDSQAVATAQKNFQRSPFFDRLQVIEGPFENIKREYLYDLIISNPPFYTNSLHNPDERKKTARHTDLTFFTTMLAFAQRSLQTSGTLQLILPTELAAEITVSAKDYGLHLAHAISIRSFENTEVIRQIISLQKAANKMETRDNFVIYAEKGVYSTAYRDILQPFFLAF